MNKRYATPEEIDKRLNQIQSVTDADTFETVKANRIKDLADGFKDEACDLCGEVLLACQHFVHCRNREGCPFSTGKTLLDYMLEEKPLTSDKNSLE